LSPALFVWRIRTALGVAASKYAQPTTPARIAQPARIARLSLILFNSSA
jgi:hypothetical protein